VITFFLELYEWLSGGGKFDDLEFKNEDPVIEVHPHIDFSPIRGVFSDDIKAEGRKIAGENRGVITLVAREFIFAIPVMRN